jgi:DNA-binding NtrC family response regulator
MESEKSSVPSGREVLVVEDEVRVRNMLSQALKEMGFTATLTSSAEAAGKILEQRDFDIIMLDLNLPGMGGIEFLESIRRGGHNAQVIILTGFGDLEAARKAIRCDVADFLIKPCALGNLEMALDRARKRRRGQIVGEGVDSAPRLLFDTAPPPEPLTRRGVELSQSEAASLGDVEQKHILSVLQKNNGNRMATARELRISLRTLYYRLGEYQKKGLVP